MSITASPDLADGLMRDRVKHGLACYISGYHPIFVMASCLVQACSKALHFGLVCNFFWISQRLLYPHAAGNRQPADSLPTHAATEAPVRVGNHLEVTFIPAEPQRTVYVWNLRKA